MHVCMHVYVPTKSSHCGMKTITKHSSRNIGTLCTIIMLQLFSTKSQQIYNFVNNSTFKKGTNVHFGWQLSFMIQLLSFRSRIFFFIYERIVWAVMYRQQQYQQSNNFILFWFFICIYCWFFFTFFLGRNQQNVSAGRQFFRMKN